MIQKYTYRVLEDCKIENKNYKKGEMILRDDLIFDKNLKRMGHQISGVFDTEINKDKD